LADDDDIEPVAFGSYWLLERVAVGGMAEVFLASNPSFAPLVALKRILPNVAANQDFIAMFLDEARIAGQLDHEGIARILDLGKHQDSYFLAMEYVAGQDLRALWDRAREANVPIPLPMVCALVMRMADALDHAHRKRDAKGRPLHIIHRDVSPQNVLVSYDGDVKLIDFGVAKAANRLVRTQTGIMKGKFAYMSPEQARAEPIDHRADVFAIGVVLYELLTGERAFKADSDFALLEKVRRVDVTPLRHLRPDAPRSLDKIVMKALARTEQQRYPWASALANDLREFLHEQGHTVTQADIGAYMRKVFASEHHADKRRLDRHQARAHSLPVVDLPTITASAYDDGEADSHDHTRLDADSGRATALSNSVPVQAPPALPAEARAIPVLRSSASPLPWIAMALAGALMGAVATVAVMSQRAPPMDAVIGTEPAGATVWKGTEQVCARTPCTLRLGAGTHALELDFEGVRTPSPVTVVEGSEPSVVHVRLNRPPQSIILETEPPGAWLWIDGQLMAGVTPLQITNQPFGKVLRMTLAKDGYEAVSVDRAVGADNRWRVDLPTATTALSLALEPADARVLVAGKERVGRGPVNVGRKPVIAEVSRPGCETQSFQLMGTGQASAQASLNLRCHPFVGSLRIVSSKRPASVRISGVELARQANLDNVVLPAGEHVVLLRSPRGKVETHTAVVANGSNVVVTAAF
jgi:serine/threonine protein kinase